MSAVGYELLELLLDRQRRNPVSLEHLDHFVVGRGRNVGADLRR
jgi:hypothetical protein